MNDLTVLPSQRLAEFTPRYEEMCQFIRATHAVDEVKDIRDKMLALQVYARQAQNSEAERNGVRDPATGGAAHWAAAARDREGEGRR